MGYFLLLATSLMWSFVGVMVKAASSMVDSSVVTLSRFLFAVVFLWIFLRFKDGKINFIWKDKWIWAGVVGKSLNYIFENIAISTGYSYGNVLVWPVQAIFLTFVAVLAFKEEMYPKKVAAVLLCIIGVILVSWKGVPLKEFMGTNLFSTVLFVLAAFGAGTHAISQKKLITYMDAGHMNYSVFALATLLTALPLPFTFSFSGNLSLIPVLALIGLGLITGISFLLYAQALKRVSFLVAIVISNSSVVFTFIWAYLFYRETINMYIGAGIVTMLAGLVLISIPKKQQLPS